MLCRHAAATEALAGNQIGIEFGWSLPDAGSPPMMFSAQYSKGPAGSAELRRLRLGAHGQGFTVQRLKPGIYRLSLGSKKRFIRQGAEYRPERSFAFSASTLNKLGEVGDAIRPVGPALLDELSRIIYLGPVRLLARRDYVWTGRMPAHIGDDGARAVDVLIASGVAYQAALKRDKALPADAQLFREAIEWLKAMNLAEGLAVRALGGSSRYELMVLHNGEAINLKDVGVGVSQVIPVVVAALFAQPGHIVIVEEPESHLHPLAQAKLAELFAAISTARGVQFIVETHSEHLFRRMQTLIARQEIKPGQAAMYFVERDGPTAKRRALTIDDYGRVTNWPDQFFGDALGETLEQAKLMFERQAKARQQS